MSYLNYSKKFATVKQYFINCHNLFIEIMIILTKLKSFLKFFFKK